MGKKIGRPRVPRKHALAEVFCARLRPDEAKEVWSAIDKSGVSKSDWLRSALLKAARTT